MPIYEYRCSKCKNVHEIWQKITDRPETSCPTPRCKGRLERMISSTGFALKGSGWYKTDYAGGGSSSPKESDAPKPDDEGEEIGIGSMTNEDPRGTPARRPGDHLDPRAKKREKSKPPKARKPSK